MVGDVRQSGPDRSLVLRAALCLIALALLLLASGPAAAQSLYKYRGENGEWIYSDRPPEDGSVVEIRELRKGKARGEVRVTHDYEGPTVVLTAHNEFHAPVEMTMDIRQIRGLMFPDPDMEMRWMLPPRSDTELFRLDIYGDGAAPFLEYEFRYLAGAPGAQHSPDGPYRAPFAISTEFPITQAYPEVATHTTPDSYYAVDMAMPVGTDVFAARGGLVFDVASDNFRNGTDIERDGPQANVVRILHDDGTYAVYAHLNWNSIRVRPGDIVERGEYIADSGNTGFSSGPHLHFVVLRNDGMKMMSVPLVFEGPDSSVVVPATGMTLTAY